MADELKQLRAFPQFVDRRLVESLTDDGFLTPAVRLEWPEPVARRLWLELHEDMGPMTDPIEPEGSRWDDAVNLFNAMEQRTWPRRIRGRVDPLDEPTEADAGFLSFGANGPMPEPASRRYSVANRVHETLLDDGLVSDFYSSWQVLPAAEAAQVGFFLRINLADEATRAAADLALRERRLPKAYLNEQFGPSQALRGFLAHRAALDAVVWASEEADAALVEITDEAGGSAGRFWLNEDQTAAHEAARKAAAAGGMTRYGVDRSALLALCAFLASRWLEWDGGGRVLMADAYRTYLAATVRLLQRAEEMTFDEIAEVVGPLGSTQRPTLHEIWPDWTAINKERVVTTLNQAWVGLPGTSLSPSVIQGFADFIAEERQDAVFLRLESFHENVFGDGAESPEAGMSSDLQGMAVAVEQLVRAMGGTRSQLIEMFQELWAGTPVAAILRSAAGLARQGRPASRWHETKAEIETLRQSSPEGAIAADMVMAHRLRGAVHHPLHESEQFEIERLMVVLLRAAAATYAHVAGAATTADPQSAADGTATDAIA
ncbi:hypothetical protein [Brevundimonas sp. R86498]|uniref:hypothetical protein n=1 Tax=Brevundimonas sp. R86498 TaxID=3093845 RepID=UPI0037C72500